MEKHFDLRDGNFASYEEREHAIAEAVEQLEGSRFDLEPHDDGTGGYAELRTDCGETVVCRAWSIYRLLDEFALPVHMKTVSGVDLTLTPDGCEVGGKLKRFDRDSEYGYMLLKTKYKGASPYCLAEYVPFMGWSRLIEDGMRKAGWIAC